MIKLYKYNYITKEDAYKLADLLESTDYCYLNLTKDDVEDFSIESDGSIEGLIKGNEYYALNHNGFYASTVDFVNFYNNIVSND